MTSYTIVGQLLKYKRKQNNWSLRELERRTNISNTYLSTIEKGIDPRSKKIVIPSPTILKKLADIYKFPYKTLLLLANYITEEDL